MSLLAPSSWKPNTISRQIDHRPTSTEVIQVRTDSGDGFLKAMGNSAGEHALACELVASQLAYWFHLNTFEFATITVTGVEGLRFSNGRPVTPGPAFITKADKGEPWGGKRRQLDRLINPMHLTRLVILDTWTVNQDRYAERSPGRGARQQFDNVFLSEVAPPGDFLLRAMDFSHSFTNGRDILEKNFGIDRIQDPKLYGNFPEFRPFFNNTEARRCVDEMNGLQRQTVQSMVDAIPPEWDVQPRGRNAMVDFILNRARFLATFDRCKEGSRPRILELLFPQAEMFEEDLSEN